MTSQVLVAPASRRRSGADRWLWLLPALVLLTLVLVVLGGDGRPLALDRVFAQRAPDGLRGLGRLVTQLGAGPVLYPVLGVLAVRRLRSREGRPVWWALLPVLALAVAQVLEGVLFVTVPRPSPVASALASSFSSGHAAAATLGWGLAAHLVAPGRRAAAPVVAVGMGLLVGASRIVLGVHWTTDVLAAIALGLVLLAVVTALDRSTPPRDVALPTRVAVPPFSSTAWWLVPAAAALLPVVLLLATPGPDRLKDLLVYQGAGGVAGAGQDVYGFRTVFDMPFTYPPFAALLSEPLSRMPIGLGQVLWTVGTLAACVPLARVALAPVVARLGLPVTLAALLLSSPLRSHLRFGQVGVFLALAVAADLLTSDTPRRSRGAGLGLAIAVKLTPAVFLPWLLVSRLRGRLVATVLWCAAASTVGLLLLWRSSVDYLGSASRDTSRFGANDIPGNQSVRGMLLRSALPDQLVQPGWLLASLTLVAAGTYGAWRLERDGRRLAAVGVLAALSVAVSPISWVHHLVWLVFPIAALVAAGRWRTALGWYALLLPGLPALGAARSGVLWQLVTDAQGLSAVAAVLLLPVLCSTRPSQLSVEEDHRA